MYSLQSRQNFSGIGRESGAEQEFADEMLTHCAKSAKDSTCILYSVGDQVVAGKSKEGSVPQADAPVKKVQLIYIGVPGSDAHRKWESGDGATIKSAKWGGEIEFTQVLTSNENVDASDENIPEQFRWIRQRIRLGNPGKSRVILIVNDVPILDIATANFSIAPLLESLATRKKS